MSSHTIPIVEELAKDYANYLKLDLSSQVCTILYITSMNEPEVLHISKNIFLYSIIVK